MTVSSETLATLRDRVELTLQDTTNAIWSTDLLDESIEKTLNEYGRARPRHLITTVTLATATREVDVSSVSGLLDVCRAWLPYTAADPEDPPEWRRFEFWRDPDLVRILDGDEPAAAEVCRIWYDAQQTLNGLVSAVATTFPVEDEDLIVTGATGYAAVSRAVDMIEVVTLHRKAAEDLRAWGEMQLVTFRAGLRLVAGRVGLQAGGPVAVAALDMWAGMGGWA